MALQIVLAGILVLAAVGAGVAVVIWNESKITDNFNPIDPRGLAPTERGKPQTILLVGDDRRFSDGKGVPSRADTMILLRLNPGANATTMLSLPRDLLVDNPSGGGQHKLNESYEGGPERLLKALTGLLSGPGRPFPIHHFVSIRFTAFSKAINTFGCVYVDVDRRYYNDNNPPAGGGGPYATIDVPAGYQRLCGEQSLAYARFRHRDSDLVREARQTNFLTEARAQIADSAIVGKRDELAHAVGKYVTTDIDSRDLLRILSLALGVVGKPTERIKLDVRDAAEGSLATTTQALRRAARQFLHPDSVPGERHRKARDAAKAGGSTAKTKARRRKATTPPTIFADPAAGKSLVATTIAPKTRFPILYPKAMERQSRYDAVSSRPYDIASSDGKTYPWQAYRIVVTENAGIGQYYGVEGTTWRDPPILDLADDQERLGGRTFLVQYDGKQIRRLMLRTPSGTYWVSNTLSNALSNAEMRAIARSLTVYRG